MTNMNGWSEEEKDAYMTALRSMGLGKQLSAEELHVLPRKVKEAMIDVYREVLYPKPKKRFWKFWIKMKIEHILDKFWKWRLLLVVYAVVLPYALIAIMPPEMSLSDTVISLNIAFVPIWVGLILWYQKTEFRDLLEDV